MDEGRLPAGDPGRRGRFDGVCRTLVGRMRIGRLLQAGGMAAAAMAAGAGLAVGPGFAAGASEAGSRSAPAGELGTGCEPPKHVEEASAERVVDHFRGLRARVVTFAGYSGAGYQNPATMLAYAARTLDALDPQQTIVNAGATAEGIGAVYRLAKQRGFRTAGIVSTQARQQSVALSPCVDLVFYVVDETWGGLLPGGVRLSPTSEAMVRVSDALIAIGGGEVARDELLAARQRGKPVEFVPADMDHALARKKAVASGSPPPTDFRGAAHAALLSVR